MRILSVVSVLVAVTIILAVLHNDHSANPVAGKLTVASGAAGDYQVGSFSITVKKYPAGLQVNSAKGRSVFTSIKGKLLSSLHVDRVRCSTARGIFTWKMILNIDT